jgi:hypothetical protein
MGAPSQLALQRQGLGLEQYRTQQAGDIAQQQMELQRQNQGLQQQLGMADLWGRYLNMFR